MSHKNSLNKIRKVCMNAMIYGVEEAGEMNHISKGRVSQIFKNNKHRVFMSYELFDGHEEKSFIELRKVFNRGI